MDKPTEQSHITEVSAKGLCPDGPGTDITFNWSELLYTEHLLDGARAARGFKGAFGALTFAALSRAPSGEEKREESKG